MKPLYNYDWSMAKNYPKKGNGLKVFGTFICGGGSTMGYKLAGYTHLGGVEIDSKMAKVYEVNHHPKYLFNKDIRDLLPIINKVTYPDLYDLDILDGSPPCTSFSLSGNREKDWGKEKHYCEGKTKQTLDDLFFRFIDIAKELQPKVVIAENVGGLLKGNARTYVARILDQFNDAGYILQLFLLDAQFMGAPQVRKRVFFVAHRKDLKYPKLKLKFNYSIIPFENIDEGDVVGLSPIDQGKISYWKICAPGFTFSTVHPKGSYFNSYKLHFKKPCPTVMTHSSSVLGHPSILRQLSLNEIRKVCSFPTDYNYLSTKAGAIRYILGMSVPPVMMAHVANQIHKQWLS